MKNYIKHFALILLLITLVSCSKDDNTPPQENNKLPERANFGGNLVTFFYNEDNTIDKLELLDDLYEFSYSNNQISSIFISNEDDEGEYLFEYDVSGKIDSYSVNGQQVDVEYNSTTRTYSYEANGRSINIELYDNDEIKEIIGRDLENDEEVTNISVFYDTSKKGAIYNSNSFNVQSYMTQTNLVLIGTYATKYPPTLLNGDTAFSIYNTYDEDGFVVRAELGNDGGVIDFFYSE